jgi:molybdate transport system substrate-binding protein
MLSTRLVSNMSVRLSSSLLILFGIFFSGFVPLVSAQQTLTVAAAADLSSIESDLANSFHRSRPQLSVRFVTAASGVLAQQIENGAPYDVFMSANAQFVEKLVARGKLKADTTRAYAEGRLGIVWKDGKKREIKDLTASWVRFFAIPNPKLAPYGQAAVQALEHAGLWKQIQPKVVYGENVRQTLQMLESKNADAAITADSLLQVKRAELIPADWHQPILQKAGVVASTKNLTGADLFLNFLTGPEAQKLFAMFGFSSPRLTDEQR